MIRAALSDFWRVARYCIALRLLLWITSIAEKNRAPLQVAYHAVVMAEIISQEIAMIRQRSLYRMRQL